MNEDILLPLINSKGQPHAYVSVTDCAEIYRRGKAEAERQDGFSFECKDCGYKVFHRGLGPLEYHDCKNGACTCHTGKECAIHSMKQIVPAAPASVEKEKDEEAVRLMSSFYGKEQGMKKGIIAILRAIRAGHIPTVPQETVEEVEELRKSLDFWHSRARELEARAEFERANKGV